MHQLSKKIGRPVTFGMTQGNGDTTLYRRILDAAAAAAADGATVVAQVAGRASGLLFGMETTYHPFKGRPTWDSLNGLDAAAKHERLRDPAVRGRDPLRGGAKRADEPPRAHGRPHLADGRRHHRHRLRTAPRDERRRVSWRGPAAAPATCSTVHHLERPADALFMIPINNYVTTRSTCCTSRSRTRTPCSASPTAARTWRSSATHRSPPRCSRTGRVTDPRPEAVAAVRGEAPDV